MTTLHVDQVSFWYGSRAALSNVTFTVEQGHVFGILGPNGCGKTTLFRLISTLLPLTHGDVVVLGQSTKQNAAWVRRQIGVTFQAPSLDLKLSVYENLCYHGWVYGLRGDHLRSRIAAVLNGLGLADRKSQVTQELSGGLKRRVEIAKSLLHEPPLLILDEPATGLDPAARLELWQLLNQLRKEQAMTIVLTTHDMDEAERCDQLLILNRGQVVAQAAPSLLKGSLGAATLMMHHPVPSEELATQVYERCGRQPRVVPGGLRFDSNANHELLLQLAAEIGHGFTGVSFAQPTLEDVFIEKTGDRFSEVQP
jgi:ABC-2 type transport system ATP-binding protein